MEFGTRGPYEIRPRTAKALKLPFLISGGYEPVKRGFMGVAMTKSGRRTGRIKGSTAGANTQTAFKGVSFRTKVIHPGLPVRRMFPTPEQLVPILDRVTAAILKRAVEQRGVAAGG